MLKRLGSFRLKRTLLSGGEFRRPDREKPYLVHTGSMLAGKVALRLMQAIRQWAKERRRSHILVHATNGISAAESDQFFRRCALKMFGGGGTTLRCFGEL